jgi:uncharacterized protein with HEPN domain
LTSDRARLLEVLDAIGLVLRHTARGKETFFHDEMVRDAALYRVGSIGESVKGLSTPFRKRHPEIEWKEIAGIRDIINHKYYNVDLDIVWTAIERDLPALKAGVEGILATDPEVSE